MGLKVVGKEPDKAVSSGLDAISPLISFAVKTLEHDAEEDAHILIQAEAIKRDPIRFRKAKAIVMKVVQL